MLLRYPGGKSRGQWSNHIVDTIKSKYRGGVYGELFFGGGGITFKLLKQKVVSAILINELDITLARLWNAVIKNPHRLNDQIREIKPSVDLFLRSKDRVKRMVGSGMDALIVNRMSHGGRGVKAGPQGGADQKGKYKIDCRWNVNTLCKRVLTCSQLLNSVEIIGGKCHAEDYEEDTGHIALAYLDPPYWQVGEELYLHSFDEEQHRRLRSFLRNRRNWILSYNNVPEIRKLYAGYPMKVGSIAGNGGTKKGSELLIMGTP